MLRLRDPQPRLVQDYKFSGHLWSRFFVDASLENWQIAKERKERERCKAEAQIRKLTATVAREVVTVRKLQDELARAQGQHLEAEATLLGAVMVQNAWRVRGAKVKLQSLVEVRALGVISKSVVRYLEKKKKRTCASMLQASARRWRARRDCLFKLARRQAATLIQATWRHRLSLWRCHSLRVANSAASALVDTVITFAKARLYQQFTLPHTACAVIQRLWRRFQRRKRALELRLRESTLSRPLLTKKRDTSSLATKNALFSLTTAVKKTAPIKAPKTTSLVTRALVAQTTTTTEVVSPPKEEIQDDYDDDASGDSTQPSFVAAALFQDMDKTELQNLDFARQQKLEKSRRAVLEKTVIRPPTEPPKRPTPNFRSRHFHRWDGDDDLATTATDATTPTYPVTSRDDQHPSVEPRGLDDDDEYGSDAFEDDVPSPRDAL